MIREDGIDNVPRQPIAIDADGVERFRANAIVRFLFDHGSIDMNQLSRLSFSRADRLQFAQLIGYSVDAYDGLEYPDHELASAKSQGVS